MDVSILHDLDRKRCGGHMSTNPIADTVLVMAEPERVVEPDRLGADGTCLSQLGKKLTCFLPEPLCN